MPIQFLRDYETKSLPPERFTAGQIIEGRSEASELHFVTRGAAAYYDPKTKALTDDTGKEVAEAAAATAVTVDVSNNRADGPGSAGRAGEAGLDPGQPQRAAAGPGEVAVTTTVAAGESKPARKRGT